MKQAVDFVSQRSPVGVTQLLQEPVVVALAKRRMDFDMRMIAATQLALARCTLGAVQDAGCTSPHPDTRADP